MFYLNCNFSYATLDALDNSIYSIGYTKRLDLFGMPFNGLLLKFKCVHAGELCNSFSQPKKAVQLAAQAKVRLHGSITASLFFRATYTQGGTDQSFAGVVNKYGELQRGV